MAYSERELALYEKLFSLKAPFDVQAGLKSGKFVCAPAAAGSMYEQSPMRLMYVGRDLNGWGGIRGETPAEIAKNVLTEGREKAKNFYHDRHKFWQLCRALMTLAGEWRSWHQHIVWSHVYKVTYNDRPVKYLPRFWNKKKIAEYFTLCVDILKAEIDLFKPKHIVFVTGIDYFLPSWLGDSFKPVFELEREPDIKAFSVISKGIYKDNVKVVATTRPEFRFGTIKEHAAIILEALNSL